MTDSGGRVNPRSLLGGYTPSRDPNPPEQKGYTPVSNPPTSQAPPKPPTNPGSAGPKK